MPPSETGTECTHPEGGLEWRKYARIGAVKFGLQCMECLELRSRLVRAGDVPLEVDTGACLMAKIDFAARRKGGGRTGLGGSGNSKRRKYEAYLRSAAWRGPNGVREFVLERDQGICQDCFAPATCVAHTSYPKDIRDTRPEHCQASCKACNDSERVQRILQNAIGGAEPRHRNPRKTHE